ncbi:MAG: hypothetical protein JO057_23310 [Chloroflexi bacterium]|nr:hypothetical protein [Chloroflexota bacterium]
MELAVLIADGVDGAAYIEHYARIVREHAVRRRYISAGQQVAELAWNRGKALEEVKHVAEAAVLGAASDTISRRAVLSPAASTADLFEYLGRTRESGLAGVATGLSDLNRMTLGLSTELYLLLRQGPAKRHWQGRSRCTLPSSTVR